MIEKQRDARIIMEDASCPLGCPRDDTVILSGRDRITKLEGIYNVVRCSGCGLVRTNPRPNLASIGHFYPDNYPPYRLDRAPSADSRGSPAAGAWLERLVRRYTTRARRLPRVEPGRMLEIGCASGDFLVEAASQGWEANGLEFSPAAAEYARRRGFHILTGSIESADLPPQHYDLAVGWMVLEHLHDPLAALQALHRTVRPGGWLALSVPDFDCIGQRIFAESWHALHLPAHMTHLTPRTARSLLTAAGWEVVRLEHQRNLSDWMISFAWSLKDRHLAAGLSRRVERYGSWSLLARLPFYPLAFLAGVTGQSGRMNIWARRMDVVQPEQPDQGTP